jgi:hypothetical protein
MENKACAVRKLCVDKYQRPAPLTHVHFTTEIVQPADGFGFGEPDECNDPELIRHRWVMHVFGYPKRLRWSTVERHGYEKVLPVLIERAMRVCERAARDKKGARVFHIKEEPTRFEYHPDYLLVQTLLAAWIEEK